MDTVTAEKKIKDARTVEDFDTYISEIEEASLVWTEYFKIKKDEYVSKYCGDEKSIGEMNDYISFQCGVSVDTVRKHWTKKFPDKRLNAVLLGMALHMSMEEINLMLSRYGKQPVLYAKSITDSICIYMIQSKAYQNNDSLAVQYENIKNHLLNLLKKKSLKKFASPKNKLKNSVDTFTINKKLLGILNEREFYEHILSHLDEFHAANAKLYDFIEEYMSENDFTMHTVSTYEGLNPNYNTRYSHIKQTCECPSRNDLIALGIALRMSVDELNHMLELAHMERLYPKDRVEAAIIFVLFDIKRNFPDIFNDNSTETGLGLSDADIMTYLNYRKCRDTEYIDVQDPEMLSYLKQAIYNIDAELWNDTKRFLDVIV